MMELRERVARLLCEQDPFEWAWHDLDATEREAFMQNADAILSLPEIKLGLEALERERELDKKLGHKIGRLASPPRHP